MKRLLLAAAALAAGISSSSAADISAPVYKAAPMTPAYNWSGFYAGVVGGYGMLDTDGDSDVEGGFVGGTLGANWQAPGSPWVGGVEVDMSWASIEDSLTVTGGGVTTTMSSEIDWFGSARLRGGYAFGNALWYVTGGLAWAHNEVDLLATGFGLTVAGSDDQTHLGWTVGGGVEFALAGPWTAKLEYLYTDFDSETYALTLAGIPMPPLTVDGELHTFRIGLNYRFGVL